MQENKGQHQCDDHAQLVDGHDLRGLSDLQCFVVAQPGSSCGQAGQDTVRIAVARLEFTPSMPILARIDVSAAKTAEPNANPNHILLPPIPFETGYSKA